jgi:hypothetical protein
MTARSLFPAVALILATASGVFGATAVAKWPPWLSIESPVNPYDPSNREAAMLVHATFREGQAQLADVSGSAEGIVGGARRSIPLRFETTSRPSVFGLRRQWPTEGAWLLRIAVRGTTAIVTLDQAGNVASVRVPTELSNGRDQLPRAVASREIDSTLAEVAKR